jgi:molybdate transport system ATP-binding protein
MIIASVKKSYPNFELDVSLHFGRELVVLTGHNGSGKTTLIRAMAGLDRPDEGKIVVLGRTFFDEKTDLSPEERHVGYVSQGGALFPWLTVEQNVRFGLKKNQRQEAAGWLEELSKELKLEGLLRRYPGRLSGGEAQRVALARALAPRPQILLLDEPLSAVDTGLRPELRRFLRRVQKEWNIPVLMVTHDRSEAHTLADRTFRLEEGRIVEEAESGVLTAAPLVSY